MITIEDYFDKIFCINLDKRPDRWQECQEECKRFNLTKVERFSGSIVLVDGKPHGHAGCTASHRNVLDTILNNSWERVLVLEDDFKILHEDFHERFDEMVKYVPEDWDILYLGGHYAEMPERRVNEYVIKNKRMFTTSSYGITNKYAKKIAEHIYGKTPIDVLYSELCYEYNSYVFEPRLIIQRPSYSDILQRDVDYKQKMINNKYILNMPFKLF